ncbi:hypothetical protein, partial [Cupriavidus sp. RAF20_2]|uniref:hypothetical protein n=1 Tax=Cupriavidus sp. RAF20_2 TaxID=3233053 RepID=UPI003F93B627
YEEQPAFRQQVSEVFFAAVSAGKLLSPTTPSTPQPLSLLRLQRGLCCEGANIKGANAGWQGVSQKNFRAQ